MKRYISASTKYERLLSLDDPINAVRVAEEDDNWGGVEHYVQTHLGLYFDFSGIRFSSGSVLIYSDPGQDNDSDIWLGDSDALLAEIDYYDYCEYIASNILIHPKKMWSRLFQMYIESIIQ